MSTEIEVRRKQVSERLYERVARLIENTDVEVGINTGDDVEESRSIEEGQYEIIA